MKVDIDSWTAALLSGEYKQGKRSLRQRIAADIDGYAHCCLGVLCDISGLGCWDKAERYTPRERGAGDALLLPMAVADAAGLNDHHASFEWESLPKELQDEVLKSAAIPLTEEDRGFMGLAVLNDVGVPFPVIAKVIRARPKGLFLD